MPTPREEQPPRKRGRRAKVESEDTREVILSAARTIFAERGYDGSSMRQIATTAGVDAALIHHYFDSKEQLFLAAVQFPVDPEEMLGRVTDGPVEHLGYRLANTFLATWEHPTRGPALEAFLRGALTNRESGQLVQTFFMLQIVGRIMPSLSGIIEPAQMPTRAGLAASQLLGLAVVRHLLRFEPLASMPRADIVSTVAPTLQRYLTGDIGGT